MNRTGAPAASDGDGGRSDTADLGTILGSVDPALSASRAAFSEALNSGALAMERTAKERTRPYSDPDNHRDELIQRAASTLVDEISRFGDIRAALSERVAALRLATEQVALVAEAEMSRESVGGVLSWTRMVIASPDGGADLAESVRAALVELDEVRRRNMGIAARAALIGFDVARATQAAASLLIMRQGEVEHYVNGYSQADMSAGLRAVVREVGKDAGYAVLEEIAKQAAVAVVTTIPLAAIVVGVVRTVAGVREELRALQTDYSRTELDDMLAFSRRVRDANRAAGEVLDSLDQLQAAIP